MWQNLALLSSWSERSLGGGWTTEIVPNSGKRLFPCGLRGRTSGVLPVLTRFPRLFAESLAPKVLLIGRFWRVNGGGCMVVARPDGERRKWTRLPLAIPVFVRSRDEKGKEFLEFATALNVSAGGMLLAVRRILSSSARIELEIPSAPVGAVRLLPKASRNLHARALRTTHSQGYCLVGLKFSRPLLHPSSTPKLRRRKVISTM